MIKQQQKEHIKKEFEGLNSGFDKQWKQLADRHVDEIDKFGSDRSIKDQVRQGMQK